METTSIKRLLKNIPLFKDLTDYEMEPIIDLSRSYTYPQGTHIFMQGEPLKNVYFIHEGRVKIYKTDLNGKEQIVNVLQEGDMFPHQGFFRQDNYPAHAESVINTTLIYIPIHSFEQFLMTHPEISMKLFRVLGDIIVDLQNRLEQQILHTTYEQIIMLLLRLAKTNGEALNEQNIRITSKFTNSELANMIGSSRETVSRTLTRLRKQKSIDTDENGYIILNPHVLEDELF